MRRAVPTLVIFIALTGAPAVAGDMGDEVRARNALSDLARSHRDQAESLRAIERTQREQVRRADQARINAQRDARSMRRFDR